MVPSRSLCILGLIGLALGGCATAAKPELGTSNLTSYIKAKRELALALGRAIGVPNSNEFQVVAVSGPEWKVGQVLSPGDLADPQTEACIFLHLPTPIKWSDIPSFTKRKSISLSAGLPEKVLKLLGSPVAANLKFSSTSEGKFIITDLSSVIIPKDEFVAALDREPCRGQLSSGLVIVRGVVSGKEEFDSKNDLGAGANLKVASTDVFKLQYDDKGDFELSDLAPVPKFYVITTYTPPTHGHSGAMRATSMADLLRENGLRAPSANVVDKLEHFEVSSGR